MHKGLFISLEGGDGAGKSTHLKLLSQKLEEMGKEVLIVREPGGTDIGEKIRRILLDKNNIEMNERTELFLYEAARAQIVEEKIRPALKDGKVVLCDRFFDSTIAYQGYGRGIDIDTIHSANMFATNNLKPDRTIIILTDSIKNSIYRATKRTGADRIEKEGANFQKKVWKGFLELSKSDPDRIRLVDLKPTKLETFKLVFAAIEDLL